MSEGATGLERWMWLMGLVVPVQVVGAAAGWEHVGSDIGWTVGLSLGFFVLTASGMVRPEARTDSGRKPIRRACLPLPTDAEPPRPRRSR